MPAVRFSRDKRGYEYVYLVHTPTRRGKPGRTRVLYWYRTPPGVRIGRKPFDEEVQRTLEQQNPGVTFDWPAIIKAEMPPPDMTEFWRERRRAEKAARQERRAAEAEEAEEPADLQVPETAPADLEAAPLATELEADELPAAGDAGAADAGAEAATPAQKKRRRRRGGRRRKPGAPGADGGDAGDAGPAEAGAEAAGGNGPDAGGDEPSE